MKLNNKYQVLTPDGFQDFAAVDLMGVSPTVRITLENDQFLECTSDHKIFINNEESVEAQYLSQGHQVLTSHGYQSVVSVEYTGKTEPVYDLIQVEGGNKFYADGILVSNCEFITFEETLINPAKLAKFDPTNPIFTEGHVRWYKKPRPQYTYCIALDPAMGTGGDDSAIQVIELPTMDQVAEWQHNKTQVEGQVRVLKDICNYLKEKDIPEDQVYWSIESNTLGEAVLVVLRDTGEENFHGTFLHDNRRDVSSRNRRKGFITTNKTKLEACSKIKSWVESEKLTINSRNLISQFKVFIRTASSYAAKQGEKDDLVMAMVLAVRMALVIAGWDDNVYGAVNSNIDYDPDHDAPMPMVIL